MTPSILTKISHVVDKRYYVKLNGVDHMLNVHNYPMSLIRNDVANLRKEVDSDDRFDNLRKNNENK